MLGSTAAIDYVTRHVGYEAIGDHERRLNAILTDRLARSVDHFWLLGPKDVAQRGGVCTMTSPSAGSLNAIERLGDEESTSCSARACSA
jgi:selenocysteine lyase/cysteine desulfurase